MNLRAFQSTMLANGAQHWNQGARAVLFQAPTGAGKTVMFAHLAAEYDCRVLVLAHRRELIRQALAKLHANGVEATPYPSATPARVNVGSIQTMSRREISGFGLVIVDECHHAVSKGYASLLAQLPAARIAGFTATPERLDGLGLGRTAGGPFDTMVVGPSVRELIDLDFLVRPRMFAPPVRIDLSAVRSLAGEYRTADLEAVMAKPSITGSAVREYEERAFDRPCVVFCVSVARARETSALFRAEGWQSVCVYGDMDPGARDRAFRDLASGRVQILTSCSLIDEGLDIPDIGCVIDLAPTKSLNRVVQRWGRGLRPATGKSDLIILDHAGNALRHGLPTSDRRWTLDGAKRGTRDVAAVVQCPTCWAMHEPAPRCPECGHDYVAERAAAEKRHLEERAGQLAEMTEDDRRLEYLRTAPLTTLMKTAFTHADLVEIGRARAYHPAWADQRSRFLPKPKPGGGAGDFDGVTL